MPWMRESTVPSPPSTRARRAAREVGEPNTPSQSGSPPRGIAAFDLGGVVPTAAAEPSAAPSTPPRAAQPTASPFAHGTFDASLFASDLAAFRPLCPVAYVPGGLVVEDALCRPGEMDGIVDWSSKEALVESSTVLDSAAPNLTATLRSFAFDLRAPSEGAWRDVVLTAERLAVVDVPPTVQRARQIVASLHNPFADQFGDA